MADKARIGGEFTLVNFIAAFIDNTKPIVAAVNGPAIGVACTTLAFCDFVYVERGSYFYTPFMSLA